LTAKEAVDFLLLILAIAATVHRHNKEKKREFFPSSFLFRSASAGQAEEALRLSPVLELAAAVVAVVAAGPGKLP
jgi:hypothetical protein